VGERLLSCGRPMFGAQARVVDASDNDLPPGEIGEIVYRGESLMTGYWNRPKETDEVMRGGWFHSGDAGYMDEEGFIFIVDRIKDMINASGFKVYPRRIEDVLYEHPAVEEATVIGIPDAYRGEAPKAFIKLKEGAQATKAELLEFLRPRLSKIELPAEIEFRDSLPKTLIGKHSKKELRAERAAKSQSA
jgi:long-chain acyl-CoA synthetase